MKKCKICGEPLKKSKNSEHYGCRNAKTVLEKVANGNIEEGISKLSKSKIKSGLKALENKTGLFSKLFR